MMTCMAVPNAGVVIAMEGGVSHSPSSINCIFSHKTRALRVPLVGGLAHHELERSAPKMQAHTERTQTFQNSPFLALLRSALAHFVPCTTNIGSLIPFAGEMSIALTSAQSALNL